MSVWRTGEDEEEEKRQRHGKKKETERKPARGIDVFLNASEFEKSWKRDWARFPAPLVLKTSKKRS